MSGVRYEGQEESGIVEVLDSCLKAHFILDLVMNSDLPKVR